MFTIEQIKAAHSKVKSGADFPAYIHDLKGLGVLHYATFVANGHTDYYGTGGYSISSPAMYDVKEVATVPVEHHFRSALLAHQNGKTDYLTFCNDAATSGVEKWVVRLDAMTCTYYDKAGNEILVEQVPQ